MQRRQLYVPAAFTLLLISVKCWEHPSPIVWPEGISQRIVTMTSKVPACSAVYEPSASRRAQRKTRLTENILLDVAKWRKKWTLQLSIPTLSYHIPFLCYYLEDGRSTSIWKAMDLRVRLDGVTFQGPTTVLYHPSIYHYFFPLASLFSAHQSPYTHHPLRATCSAHHLIIDLIILWYLAKFLKQEASS